MELLVFWYNNFRHGICIVSGRSGIVSLGGVSVVSLEAPETRYNWNLGAYDKILV